MVTARQQRSPVGAFYRTPLGAFGPAPGGSEWTGIIDGAEPAPNRVQIPDGQCTVDTDADPLGHTVVTLNIQKTDGSDAQLDDINYIQITGNTSGAFLDCGLWLATYAPALCSIDPGGPGFKTRYQWGGDSAVIEPGFTTYEYIAQIRVPGLVPDLRLIIWGNTGHFPALDLPAGFASREFVTVVDTRN